MLVLRIWGDVRGAMFQFQDLTVVCRKIKVLVCYVCRHKVLDAPPGSTPF